jgi:hypothetical protein
MDMDSFFLTNARILNHRGFCARLVRIFAFLIRYKFTTLDEEINIKGHTIRTPRS